MHTEQSRLTDSLSLSLSLSRDGGFRGPYSLLRGVAALFTTFSFADCPRRAIRDHRKRVLLPTEGREMKI